MKTEKSYTCRKLLALLVSIGLDALGLSMMMKAGIGIGPWDSMSQSLSLITGIEVGTVGMLLNFACIAFQILILKRDFRKIQLLQIALSFVLGILINFFYYGVLGDVVMLNYWMRLAFLLSGCVIVSFSVGAIMNIDLVTCAVEGACMAFSEKRHLVFYKVRLFLDFAVIIVSLAQALIFRSELTVREGTVITMLIFSPVMNVFMKIQAPLFTRLHIMGRRPRGKNKKYRSAAI